MGAILVIGELAADGTLTKLSTEVATLARALADAGVPVDFEPSDGLAVARRHDEIIHAERRPKFELEGQLFAIQDTGPPSVCPR